MALNSVPKSREAIATVTSNDFLHGTVIALHSFLRVNSWFDGEIAVIHERLSADGQRLLKSNFPAVVLRPASASLSGALDILMDAEPSLTNRRDRFLSLDAFAIKGFDKILFFDSDTLFLDDVRDLFDRAEPLLVCPDSSTLLSLYRDRDSFLVNETPQGAFPHTFNAGMMRIGASCLEADVHQALIGALAPENWTGHSSPFTDQRILNIHFADEASLVEARFNLLLGTPPFPAPDALAFAAMLHFNGPHKPWHASWSAASGPPNPTMIAALKLWNSAQDSYLTHWHLRAARGGADRIYGD